MPLAPLFPPPLELVAVRRLPHHDLRRTSMHSVCVVPPQLNYIPNYATAL
jgi:hypothetical protein